MARSFSVEHGAIAAAAASVAAEAADLDRLLATFESAAYSVHDAFGPWGASHDVAAEYLDVAHDALTGLFHLRATLAGDADRLTATARAYGAADAASDLSR